jgi:hypothetical protein
MTRGHVYGRQPRCNAAVSGNLRRLASRPTIDKLVAPLGNGHVPQNIPLRTARPRLTSRSAGVALCMPEQNGPVTHTENVHVANRVLWRQNLQSTAKPFSWAGDVPAVIVCEREERARERIFSLPAGGSACFGSSAARRPSRPAAAGARLEQGSVGGPDRYPGDTLAAWIEHNLLISFSRAPDCISRGAPPHSDRRTDACLV